MSQGLAPKKPFAAPIVERLSVRVVVDSRYERFLPKSTHPFTVIEHVGQVPGRQMTSLACEWGLSLHLESHRAGSKAQYMLDFGFTPEIVLRNADLLDIDPAKIDGLILSHAHRDHFGGMAELVKEGKTRFISLSECSADSLRRGASTHPLASLQMEYSIFSRDAETQGQLAAVKELGMALMAYAVLVRGFVGGGLTDVNALGKGDLRARLPRFQPGNIEKNLDLRARLEGFAKSRGATLAQLSIAWPIAIGASAGTCIVPIPGAKTRAHLEENVKAADLSLSEADLAAIAAIAPPGAAAGSRYPDNQMHRLNV